MEHQSCWVRSHVESKVLKILSILSSDEIIWNPWKHIIWINFFRLFFHVYPISDHFPVISFSIWHPDRLITSTASSLAVLCVLALAAWPALRNPKKDFWNPCWEKQHDFLGVSTFLVQLLLLLVRILRVFRSLESTCFMWSPRSHRQFKSQVTQYA